MMGETTENRAYDVIQMQQRQAPQQEGRRAHVYENATAADC